MAKNAWWVWLLFVNVIRRHHTRGPSLIVRTFRLTTLDDVTIIRLVRSQAYVWNSPCLVLEAENAQEGVVMTNPIRGIPWHLIKAVAWSTTCSLRPTQQWASHTNAVKKGTQFGTSHWERPRKGGVKFISPSDTIIKQNNLISNCIVGLKSLSDLQVGQTVTSSSLVGQAINITLRVMIGVE